MNLKQKLIKEVQRRGGQVVDESAGRWNVLQLEAPKGQLWSEGVSAIRVSWQVGTKCNEACLDEKPLMMSLPGWLMNIGQLIRLLTFDNFCLTFRDCVPVSNGHADQQQHFTPGTLADSALVGVPA